MKRSTTINEEDYRGMRAFAGTAGKAWRGGIIFYSGDHILPTPIANTVAVTYAMLWDGLTS